MHDLLIANARIHDGLGSAPVDGDLAIADGRIAAIGRDLGPARERIDAGGLCLMPGIIDNHTHYDVQITWDPLASPWLVLEGLEAGAVGLSSTTSYISTMARAACPCPRAWRRRRNSTRSPPRSANRAAEPS
ncbi:MAG: hypothetical protein IT532_00985 [Burkholderiales bacterium]|nr:hypothetical protein [Burkholderiales bacterium]